MIYADNAATTYPKPKNVYKAVQNCMIKYGANPGRSGHKMSIEAGNILLYTREMLCDLFKINDPFQIIFTFNCTDSINLVTKGLLKSGDHVITTMMEHNAVIRPLKFLEQNGIEVTCVKCSTLGKLDPIDIKKAIKSNTKLIITTHASNVTGTIMPIKDIGTIARKYGIPYMVDAAQTAGTLPIDLSVLPIDFLAFSGHKGLLGPQGTGGLYVGSDLPPLVPLRQGGTGSQSESLYQPDFLPDKYEAGTMNTPGIAGLGAGVKFILNSGLSKLLAHETRLNKLFIEALSHIKGIKIYGSLNPNERIGPISLNIYNKDSSEIANLLDEHYNIAVRGGLHCAPLAHQTIGTLKQGTVRFSFNIYNTIDDIKYCVKALNEISKS